MLIINVHMLFVLDAIFYLLNDVNVVVFVGNMELQC